MKTVLCHGTFDILHNGHIEYLKACRAYGDHLTVALSSDHMAAIRKGPGRPINLYKEREAVLEAIKYVDAVIEAPHSTDKLIANLMILIGDIKPDVFVTSYNEFRNYSDRFKELGTQLVIRKGIPINSSTSIIRRIQAIEHN
jgi:cytidyltransferase-like protein